MPMPTDTAGADLARLVGRIESIEEEIADAKERIGDEFRLAKSQGWDVKAIRALLKERKSDPTDRAEFEAIVELYRNALAGTPLGTYAAGRAA
jgi:uncharacterized protein (UPF0335 family)